MRDRRQAKPCQGGTDGGGAGWLHSDGLARGPQFAIERVRGAGAVHDDRSFVALGQGQAGASQDATERMG